MVIKIALTMIVLATGLSIDKMIRQKTILNTDVTWLEAILTCIIILGAVSILYVEGYYVVH